MRKFRFATGAKSSDDQRQYQPQQRNDDCQPLDAERADSAAKFNKCCGKIKFIEFQFFIFVGGKFADGKSD